MEEVGVERGRSRNDVNIVVMHKIKKLLIKKNTAFFFHIKTNIFPLFFTKKDSENSLNKCLQNIVYIQKSMKHKCLVLDP